MLVTIEGFLILQRRLIACKYCTLRLGTMLKMRNGDVEHEKQSEMLSRIEKIVCEAQIVEKASKLFSAERNLEIRDYLSKLLEIPQTNEKFSRISLPGWLQD